MTQAGAPEPDTSASGAQSLPRQTSRTITILDESASARAQSLVHRLGEQLRHALAAITAVGWSTIALMLGAWLIGWWFGWIELSIIATAALACLVVACGFVVGATDLDVEVELAPQRVVVGRRAAGQVTVTNPGARRVLPSRLELVVGAGVAEFAIPSLGAGDQHEELFVLPTHRRGIVPVGPAVTVRSDPLGLLRRAVPWTQPVPLYVHPRTTHLGHLGAGFLRDLEGQPTPDLSPSDIAFHTLREYQHGDDRRFVHWMTSARVGELMVRQFTDTRRAHLAVVLDAGTASYLDGRAEVSEEFELAVSITGSLAARAIADEQDVTLSHGRHVLPTVNGPSMLDALAGAELSRRSKLVDQTDRLVRNSSGVSLAVVVTGSTTSIADLRAATMRFPIDVRTLAIRVDPASETGLRPVGSTIVLTVASLDELAQLMWAVTT